MIWIIFKRLHYYDLIRVKTGLSVLARCTFVNTNVLVLLPSCSRLEESASELGFLEIKDLFYGT